MRVNTCLRKLRKLIFLVIMFVAVAASGGAVVKNDGASKDRMDMIDAYLGKFGMRGLPLLSVKFGTTQLHGEASSYLKPTDDEWMRTMPEVSWSFPQGTKATVLFVGVRLNTCLSAPSLIMHPDAGFARVAAQTSTLAAGRRATRSLGGRAHTSTACGSTAPPAR